MSLAGLSFETAIRRIYPRVNAGSPKGTAYTHIPTCRICRAYLLDDMADVLGELLRSLRIYWHRLLDFGISGRHVVDFQVLGDPSRSGVGVEDKQ